MDIKRFNPTKPTEMFHYLVGNDIQRNIAKAVIEQYEKAYENCYNNFRPIEARDLLPYYRRTCIEDIMPDLAERIGNCVIKPRKNKAKNCSHRLILNNGIILTQSKVEQREVLPRNAEFRKGYAKTGQLLLFDNEDEIPNLDNESPLYAIITHMPIESDRNPWFVDIIFPDKDYKVILGRIKLLDNFSDIMPMTVQEEAIPENNDVKDEPSIKIINRKTS